MRLCCLLLTLWIGGLAFGQQTPQQIINSAAPFQTLSDRQLQMASVTLLAQIAGVPLNAATIIANASQFQPYSDRQHREAQTYLLSSIQASQPGQAVLLNPPRTGFGRSSPYQYDHNMNSGFFLIAPPGTSGVVRDLWCVPDGTAVNKGLLTNLGVINLRLYPDCGSNTNPPLSANLAFDVPIGMLLGDIWRIAVTNQNYAVVRQSQWIDSTDISTNDFERSYIVTFRLKTPMPFTNGFLAQLWNTFSNAASPYGYIAANWDAGVGFPYSNYRLRAATYLNSPNVLANNTIFSIDTAGIAVGVLQSAFNTTNAVDQGGTFDSHSLLFVTDTGVTNSWPGNDDFFFNTYSFASGQQLGYEYGQTHLWVNSGVAYPDDVYLQYAMEGYRWFTHDYFIWNTSLRGYYDLSGYNQRINANYFVLIYYGP